jgi:hypothetical protein
LLAGAVVVAAVILEELTLIRVLEALAVVVAVVEFLSVVVVVVGLNQAVRELILLLVAPVKLLR